MPIFCFRFRLPAVLGALSLLCALVVFAAPRPAVFPILMYHQVSEKSAKLGEYVVSCAELEGDIKTILAEGFTPIFASDLAAWNDGLSELPEKPILLTFDDNYMSDFVYVFPLLQKYGVKANFAVVGALADRYSSGEARHVDYANCTWDEIRTMRESGLCEFLSHSYNMHDYSARRGILRTDSESDEEYESLLNADIAAQDAAFCRELGAPPAAFVYPFGSVDRDAARIIDRRFSLTFGVYEKMNRLTRGTDALRLLHRYNRTHNRDILKILEKAK